ncbi:MAG: SusC/RagA family TonB-linked outer membrane protein [Niabella sp.]
MRTKTQQLNCIITGLFLLLVPVFLWAQQKTITGTVRSKSADAALSNISVVVSGTSRGAITNNVGYYSISASPGEKLTFSGVGYITKELTIGKANVLNIELEESESESLENVVVTTALGIKREARSLGFSQTTLDSSDITDAISSNWTDALSGKVAGLNMIRSGSGPVGSNKIILRGENNLTGENEALIVVDGVVMGGNTRRTGNSGEAVYGVGSDNMPADYGSGLNDINPEDIESVTVLKGPGAAALYGQRGANGAIIITTKSSKKKQKGWNVSLNSNYAVEQVNRWPDMQYKYGQGLDGANYYSYGTSADGSSTSGTSSAYGPKFDGQYFFQYNPNLHTVDSVRTLWQPYTNKINDFFEDGNTFTNGISLDGSFGAVNARINYTNATNKWIIPNTGYERNTISVSLNTTAFKKLKLSTKVNYSNRWSPNLPGAGYGNQSIMYWYIFWQPNADLDWLKDYWRYTIVNNPDGTKTYIQRKDSAIFYPYSSYPENPYAISYEFLNKSNRNSITGNFSATYDFTKNLSLMVRTSIDWGDEYREQRRPYDAGSKLVKGSVRQQSIQSQEWTSDFLLRYKKDFSKDFKTTATLGGSTLTNTYDRMGINADSLNIPGYYYLYNSLGDWVYLPYSSKFVVNSLYGMITTAYKNYLFFDFTGRRDWSSVLASPYRTANSGFFYPSANVSYVISDAFKLPEVINFAKLRFSVAGVGSGGTTPYRNTDVYVPDYNFIYDSIYQNPTLLANPNMRPLKTISYEVGGNASFFKSRLTIDVAAYIGNTKAQLLDRIIDASSGYRRAGINAGVVRNKGLELVLSGTPVKTKTKKGFVWNSIITFATNSNKIISMPDTSLVISTGKVGGGQVVAKVGGSMGDLYGRGYVRAPDGQVVYDSVTGNALITTDVVHIGNTIPKYKASFGNKFSYKNWRLNFLFDGQWGGVAHSLMHYKMVEQGKLTVTVPGRYNGIIGNGVVQNADGSYRKNDVIAKDIDEYYRSHMGMDNAEGSTFSTDFIKWRELRLEHNFPLTGGIKKAGFKKITIAVYGRDLFIWSPWPMFDPEFGTLEGSDIVRGFEVAQFPSTRTIGGSIQIGF